MLNLLTFRFFTDFSNETLRFIIKGAQLDAMIPLKLIARLRMNLVDNYYINDLNDHL